jgi:exodeoxyribonuclease VII small subunit
MTQELTFEDLFAELEDTIRRLEAGNCSLAESVALYEKSAALADQCNRLLDAAELKVQQLTQRSDGSLGTQPFEGWQSS